MEKFKIFILLIFIKLSSANECGEVKFGHGLSIGANYSAPGQWPWLASIFVKKITGDNFICGSSIISKKIILGAAHCVHPKRSSLIAAENFYALLGRYNLSNSNDPHSATVEFSDILIHPEWNSKTKDYDADIALFLMKSEVKFTDYIQPICLPSAHAEVFDVRGTVAGYGRSETSQYNENIPKHLEIKSVNHGVCLYRERELAKYGSIRMFCAGSRGKNACKGDSGSPFMVKVNRKWTINGIVSVSAFEDCRDNDFVLFTQVQEFLEWIEDKMYPSLHCASFKRETCDIESLEILEPNHRITSITGLKLEDYKKLVRISIDNAQVHYLPDFSLLNEKYPNFKELSIYNSGLKELDRSKLALLPQLTHFDVGGNQIKELPDNVFDELVNLEVLEFNKNRVKSLPQELLWNLPKLKIFHARYNQIQIVPTRFFEKNKNIEWILLSNNKISRIGIDLRSLPKLYWVDMEDNRCIHKCFNLNGLFGCNRNIDEFQKIIIEQCS